MIGASRGLGYACAAELSREAAQVMISARDPARLTLAAGQISRGTGEHVLATPADLTNEADVARLVIAAAAAFDHVDVLVLSTGHPQRSSFSQADDEQWQSGVDLVLRPAIRLARALLPGMRSRGYGRLIFIGSIYGVEPEPGSAVQSTLRAGLNALSKSIAGEAGAAFVAFLASPRGEFFNGTSIVMDGGAVRRC